MAGYTLWDPNLGNVPFGAAVLSVIGTGNQWFVNATGNDSNPGTQAAPFASLAAAQKAAVANNGDVVYVQGTVHLTATLVWAKNGVSLVSLEAPSNNGRGRISSQGATAFSPLVSVTANGCSFIGIGTFHGGFTGATGAQVCWAEAGGRNYYQNCQLLGGGDLTTAALAGMRSLTVSSGENLFQECTVGLDTIVRATNANASLEFLLGAPRNVFRRCVFQANVSDVADVHITVGADGIDRYALFDKCTFINAVESGSSTMSAAITANAAAGGLVLLQDCVCVGATAIATTGPVYGTGNVPVATTSGIAIKLT
jgi:hypothetical protein